MEKTMNRKIATIISLNARALVLAAALIALTGSAVSLQAQTVTVVSAASFANDKVVAPGSIASAFGAFTTQGNQVAIATTVPLPTTLGGVRVRIGNTDAGLFFVAPSQINFLVPAGLPDATNTTITVTNSNNTTGTGTFTIVRSAPGLFSIKATGQGTAAAQTTFDGVTYQNAFKADGTENELSAGTKARPNVLVLYTTGLRNTPAANPNDSNGVAEAVTLRIQGVPATVLYAGPAPGLEGSDQINAIIPPELAGLGSVNVRVRANNRDSNTVTIRLGGQVPDARAADITAGQTVNGTLTVDDQVQAGSSGNTFFFDAYKFSTTAANTPIAVDLRSTAFDAAALLYRLDGTQLTLIAADDESGSYGSRPADNNHNAMLMTVIQNPGNYVIFVTSSDFEPNGIGNYSVRLVNATITPLTYGQTVSGTVANTDLQNSVGVYYDMYSFNGTQGDRQSIRLTSTAFDSFLILLRNDGDPYLVADDNGAGGNDALIDPTHGNNGINGQPLSSLPRTGTYIIVATPFEANRTGNYNLTLNRLTGLTGEPEPTNAWNQLFRAPSREIRSLRVVGGDADKPSVERFGTRRIVQ